jgi:hypothetical protein
MTFPGDPRVPVDVRREQEERAAAEQAHAADGLGDLTKDQLLAEAERRGIDVKTSASKAEILAAVRATPPADQEATVGENAEAEE